MHTTMGRIYAGLALILVVAAVVRLVYVLAIAPTPATAVDDTFWNLTVSRNIADGHGFVTPVGPLFSQRLVPTASRPPLYPLALAVGWKLGAEDGKDLLLFGVLFGSLTVFGVGLLGRRVGGDRLGIVSAAIAALYPLLFVADGALLSETMYGPVAAFTLLAAWALAERPTVGKAALVGTGVGMAALIRPEAVLLLPLLALPLAWRGAGGSSRWLRLGATTICCALVISPWVIRNERTFNRLLLSTNYGVLVAWTNCDQTYYGPNLGWIYPGCLKPASGNEAEQSATWRDRGLRYAREHAVRLPVVVTVRLLRAWGLYDPFQSTNDVGRTGSAAKLGVLLYYPLLMLTIVGGWSLRRRGAPLLVLVAPIVLVSITMMTSYGSIRLRFLAELPLVVLAAAGALSLWDRRPSKPAPVTRAPHPATEE